MGQNVAQGSGTQHPDPCERYLERLIDSFNKQVREHKYLVGVR